MSHNILAFSVTIVDFSVMFSLFSIDAAEIIHIRPVEEGKKEYYVHYHGCKLFFFHFPALLEIFIVISLKSCMKIR